MLHTLWLWVEHHLYKSTTRTREGGRNAKACMCAHTRARTHTHTHTHRYDLPTNLMFLKYNENWLKTSVPLSGMKRKHFSSHKRWWVLPECTLYSSGTHFWHAICLTQQELYQLIGQMIITGCSHSINSQWDSFCILWVCFQHLHQMLQRLQHEIPFDSLQNSYFGWPYISIWG